MYDVVVVGGGAAGLSAALVLARARSRVAVVDAGAPRNAPAAHMHGFVSRDGIPPAEFLAKGRAEVAGYGGELIEDRVEGISPGFYVRLVGGRQLKARRILIATGLRDELPDIPGVRERWGNDVLHCPFCHGYEVRDQPIGVLGNAAPQLQGRSVHQALLVRQWSHDVVLFPDELTLSTVERDRLAARGVTVAEGRVTRLVVDDDQLRGVELAGGRFVPRAAVYVAPVFVPFTALATSLGCELDESGFVAADPMGRTTAFGVYAAGNATTPMAQVITAASAGSTAATAITADLLEEDVERALEVHSTGGAFSPAAEQQVCDLVTGDRRHGM